MAMPGVAVLRGPAYQDAVSGAAAMEALAAGLAAQNLTGIALVVVCDEAAFTAANEHNFVWVSFTRSNPAADIYGVRAFTHQKHWGCEGPLIIDARKKPHHAPELQKDPDVERRIDRLWEKGGSLYHYR